MKKIKKEILNNLKVLFKKRADFNTALLILISTDSGYYFEIIDKKDRAVYEKLFVYNYIFLNGHNKLSVSKQVFKNVKIKEDKDNGDDLKHFIVDKIQPLFKDISIDRAMDVPESTRRLKRLLKENKNINLNDVLEAVETYISSVNNPTYLIYMKNFIIKGTGKKAYSPLLSYIKDIKGDPNKNNVVRNKII